MKNEDLVLLIQNGDIDAFNLLLEKNKGLVYKYAHKWKKNRKFELEDLVSIGYYELYNAANTYKQDRGAQFSTYFVQCLTFKYTGLHDKEMTDKRIANHKKFHVKQLLKRQIDPLEYVLFNKPDSQVEERLEDYIDNLAVHQVLQEVNKQLKDRDKIILKEVIMKGKTVCEVADLLSISHQAVSQKVKKIKSMLVNIATRLEVIA